MSRSPARCARLPRELLLLAAGWLVVGTSALAQFNEGTSSTNDRQLEPQRLPIFYPPNPPPLGRAVNRTPQPPDGRASAPAELAPFVSDVFYPHLGSRYHLRQLKDTQRSQLEAYDLTRSRLLRELREEIARVSDFDAGARLEALVAFSATQAAPLKQLEETAEKLRRNLALSHASWTAYREWRLGDKHRRGYSPIEIAAVMRGYAFYHDSLALEQRHLLREIAIELHMASDDQAKATAAQPFTFFPPEPARVLFPTEMPEEAARKLAEFQTKKTALKKELYDAVQRQDGGGLAILRGDTLGATAGKQIARLAELEKLAEEIRRALPPASGAPPAIRSSLTPTLSARVERMMETYIRAQRDAAGRLDAIMERERKSSIQINYRFDPDGLKFVVIPPRSSRSSPAMKSKTEAIRSEIASVVETYGRTLAELLNERNAIGAEIATQLGTAEAAKAETTLNAAMRAVVQRDSAPAFEEYRFAVFEPGLSPAQRRLLLHGVIQRLDLPMPRGELQPVARAGSW